ncbi:MAG: ATP-binding protein [Clostridia bacterium]|nr:ATP-binding protein [Clostridia bacterium]
MFKRKIYSKMLEWKNVSDGDTALLVEGARRIGKSTIVEEFAKNEYDSYIMIDFSKAAPEIVHLFDDVSDLNYLFLQLQLRYRVTLHERRSLIIFDEVQLCPPARQAIKHLVADHRYDYVETGSLISINKNVKDILIPSEEETLQMYPMDYEEFLWAIGDNTTFSIMRELYESGKPVGNEVHRQLMRTFRLYMAVGGMPQAVTAFNETNNFEQVDRVKRRILDLYYRDLEKVDERIQLLFEAIPAELNRNASRYQVSSVLPNARADKVLDPIKELKDSKCALVAYHANDPNAGLANNKDLERFKLFLADTGLFVTLAFKDKDFTENIIYEKMLSDKLSANLGYLYENVVAQMLAANGHELYYYTFPQEVGHRSYEIDFLLAEKNKIISLEVKSGNYTTHKSIDAFTEKYSSRVLKRYLLHCKDFKKEGDLICLPIYFAPFL